MSTLNDLYGLAREAALLGGGMDVHDPRVKLARQGFGQGAFFVVTQ